MENIHVVHVKIYIKRWIWHIQCILWLSIHLAFKLLLNTKCLHLSSVRQKRLWVDWQYVMVNHFFPQELWFTEIWSLWFSWVLLLCLKNSTLRLPGPNSEQKQVKEKGKLEKEKLKASVEHKWYTTWKS